MFKKYFPYLLSLVGGALYASGFPMAFGHSFILGPLIGFFLLSLNLNKLTTLKEQLFLALAYSLGFYLFGFYWIPHLLQEFGGFAPPLNFLLGIFLAPLIIPQVYFYVLVKRKISSLSGLAFAYALLEILIPQQFPAHLGHTFISLAPFSHLNLAPIFGAPIYSFITVVIALSLLNKSYKHLTAALTLLVFNFLPIGLSHSTQLLPTLSVRIVQPNVGNFIKVDSERGGRNALNEVFQSYYSLSTAPAQAPLDLIIWPETSFPTLLSSDLLLNSTFIKIPKLLQDIISKTNSELFIGGYDLKNRNENYQIQGEYNTAFHFNKSMILKNVYHKINLIPFGEDLPFGPLNPFIGKYLTGVSLFAAGEEKTLFHLENNTPFVSAICYEILFPQFIRSTLNNQKEEPQFLINLTNDSWYGNTAEPAQHLFLAKWRAIEFNLPIIRSTNTGITTVINANGSETENLKIGEKTFLDLKLQFEHRDPTPYERFGYLNFILLALLLIAVEKILLLKARANV
jgi:apolipoprotein N-acyltransferase